MTHISDNKSKPIVSDKLANWPKTRLFEYVNAKGDTLAITFLGNNKYPSLCFKEADTNVYRSIGFLRDPDQFVDFWRSSSEPFNSKGEI